MPKDNEVLIKSGICGDFVVLMFMVLNQARLSHRKIQPGIGLGHECAGTVVAVGNRVKQI
ncbi:alcohol dehydrogenase catalytic domain-containing protein [Salmonella enterica subsp. enterica]|nr:alcohol dehydrogenase catalytic domain-containing protein [Salmonella enterica subsp. enterica]